MGRRWQCRNGGIEDAVLGIVRKTKRRGSSSKKTTYQVCIFFRIFWCKIIFFPILGKNWGGGWVWQCLFKVYNHSDKLVHNDLGVEHTGVTVLQRARALERDVKYVEEAFDKAQEYLFIASGSTNGENVFFISAFFCPAFKVKIRPFSGRLIFFEPFAHLLHIVNVKKKTKKKSAEFDVEKSDKSDTVKGLCKNNAVFLWDRASVHRAFVCLRRLPCLTPGFQSGVNMKRGLYCRPALYVVSCAHAAVSALGVFCRVHSWCDASGYAAHPGQQVPGQWTIDRILFQQVAYCCL